MAILETLMFVTLGGWILADGQVALERREVGSWSTPSPLSPDPWRRWLTGSVSLRTSHSCTSRYCNALACHSSGR